jgi:hypothetical protein
MDQTAPEEIRTSGVSLRKIAYRAAIGVGMVVMMVWSIVLPVLGILYLVEHL